MEIRIKGSQKWHPVLRVIVDSGHNPFRATLHKPAEYIGYLFLCENFGERLAVYTGEKIFDNVWNRVSAVRW